MNIINEKNFESINQEITEEQIMQEELDRFNQIKQSFIDNKTHNITNDVYYEDNNVSNKELIKEDKKDEIKSGDELIQKLTPTELIELEQPLISVTL